jgi:hypothetical protein
VVGGCVREEGQEGWHLLVFVLHHQEVSQLLGIYGDQAAGARPACIGSGVACSERVAICAGVKRRPWQDARRFQCTGMPLIKIWGLT